LTLGGSEHQSGGNNVAGRKARRETDRLCSDKVAGVGGEGGWHSSEIKLKNLKHEAGPIALEVK
jgi:hypothetical protein